MDDQVAQTQTPAEGGVGAVQDPAPTQAAQPATTAPTGGIPPASATPPIAPQPQAGQGPWDAELAQQFADPALRSQVDGFLRSTVQPYVTQREQELADAKSLYEDFHTTPDETFLDVAGDLYTPEQVAAIKAITEQGGQQVQPQAAQPAAETPQRDPEVQALLDRERERQEKEAFDAEFARIKATPGNEDIDYDRFIPFVAQYGDFGKAVAAYQEHERAVEAAILAKHNLAPQAATPDPATPAPAQAAPPTLGSDVQAGGSAPPAEPQHTSYHEAIDDFFGELRSTGQSVGIESSQPAPPTT